MSKKYRSIQKGQPLSVAWRLRSEKGGGDIKFYAQAFYNGEMTTDKIVKRIEKFSALIAPAIHGVSLPD